LFVFVFVFVFVLWAVGCGVGMAAPHVGRLLPTSVLVSEVPDKQSRIPVVKRLG